MAKVLIVEDGGVIGRGMAGHLALAGFDPLLVEQGEGEVGLARLRYERPDACVLDLMLPGLDGREVIETVRREGIGTPIVVVTGRGQADVDGRSAGLTPIGFRLPEAPGQDRPPGRDPRLHPHAPRRRIQARGSGQVSFRRAPVLLATFTGPPAHPSGRPLLADHSPRVGAGRPPG
jgi:CheY-like chemotaxis protein